MVQPSVQAPKKRSCLVVGLLVVAALVMVIFVIGLALNDSPPAGTAAPSSGDPHADLRRSIERALGSSNRDVQRLSAVNFDDPEPGAIFVHWAINDNLTENLIRASARIDATDILEAIATSKVDYSYVILSGSFPMQDQFGNATESNVVTLTFYKATIDKVNWANFISQNVYSIADQAAVWTEFQGE